MDIFGNSDPVLRGHAAAVNMMRQAMESAGRSHDDEKADGYPDKNFDTELDARGIAERTLVRAVKDAAKRALDELSIESEIDAAVLFDEGADQPCWNITLRLIGTVDVGYPETTKDDFIEWVEAFLNRLKGGA